jgi:hypothetical protein
MDLSTEVETRLPWTYVDETADLAKLIPGRYLIAGAGSAVAVAQIIDVAADGLIHARLVRGTIASNRHLLSDGPLEA